MTIEQAEDILRNLNDAYRFLTDDRKPWCSVTELASGLKIAPDAVVRWCENPIAGIPGAVHDAATGEWRVPRDAFVIFLAQLVSL